MVVLTDKPPPHPATFLVLVAVHPAVQMTAIVPTVKNATLVLDNVLMMLEKMVMTARAAIVNYVSTVNVKMLLRANLAQLARIVESVMVQVIVIQVIMMMINVKEIRVNIVTQEVVLITLMGRNHSDVMEAARNAGPGAVKP
jgi:hypothetical protein